ncbi:hypothetical protein C5S35_18070 [Candidatus Methanophagaceae archaeon]|nr:hypothetical protein C5S35_18070 [Methanophagales archaeon]
MGRNKIGRKAKKKVKVRASYATIDEIKIIGGES